MEAGSRGARVSNRNQENAYKAHEALGIGPGLPHHKKCISAEHSPQQTARTPTGILGSLLLSYRTKLKHRQVYCTRSKSHSRVSPLFEHPAPTRAPALSTSTAGSPSLMAGPLEHSSIDFSITMSEEPIRRDQLEGAYLFLCQHCTG